MGDTLGLFAAGIVLLLLLIASYSRRSTWLALGSMALSIAVVAACLLLVAICDPSQGRVRLSWIESKLPLVLDQQTAEALSASLERIAAAPPCGTAECSTVASEPPPPAEHEPMQASATAGWFDTQAEPKAATYPVAWSSTIATPKPPSPAHGAFRSTGPMSPAKPWKTCTPSSSRTSTEREIELALDIEGPAHDAQAVIPPNARFGLISATPYDAKQGGAILTFRYVQAGQRKSSILYLSPSMVARLASRG